MILDLAHRRVFFELCAAHGSGPRLGHPVALFLRDSGTVVWGVPESFTVNNDEDTLVVRFRKMRAVFAPQEDFDYLVSLPQEQAIQAVERYTSL